MGPLAQSSPNVDELLALQAMSLEEENITPTQSQPTRITDTQGAASYDPNPPESSITHHPHTPLLTDTQTAAQQTPTTPPPPTDLFPVLTEITDTQHAAFETTQQDQLPHPLDIPIHPDPFTPLAPLLVDSTTSTETQQQTTHFQSNSVFWPCRRRQQGLQKPLLF